jgi:hypothetical protein
VIETPKDTNSRLIKGEILALGPKVTMPVTTGECVLFTQACVELKAHRALPEDELLICEDDLVGIVARDARVTDGASPDV